MALAALGLALVGWSEDTTAADVAHELLAIGQLPEVAEEPETAGYNAAVQEIAGTVRSTVWGRTLLVQQQHSVVSAVADVRLTLCPRAGPQTVRRPSQNCTQLVCAVSGSCWTFQRLIPAKVQQSSQPR